ncbi:hypothetical protein [Prosthecobacter vanneervenii]|uniref:Uncharacterized protein n=1 Tax=Prosthecobacter vanneervenii TaxID=48466 RepID=A0A7W8DKR9_9BACT|nr:hypothetical protein [Prosthecobacter vanneervenii]MBB5033141.1 hypothetical protein [Prosthecobacter vanneervenii]
MSAEATKLRSEIAEAEKRLAALESRPGLTPVIRHQIEKAKEGLRDMRIKLAGMEPRSTPPCHICGGKVPAGWLVCEACTREVPARLMMIWKSASHYHHAAAANKQPTIQLAERERLAAEAIYSHLRQHSSAIL